MIIHHNISKYVERIGQIAILYNLYNIKYFSRVEVSSKAGRAIPEYRSAGPYKGSAPRRSLVASVFGHSAWLFTFSSCHNIGLKANQFLFTFSCKQNIAMCVFRAIITLNFRPISLCLHFLAVITLYFRPFSVCLHLSCK